MSPLYMNVHILCIYYKYKKFIQHFATAAGWFKFRGVFDGFKNPDIIVAIPSDSNIEIRGGTPIALRPLIAQQSARSAEI